MTWLPDTWSELFLVETPLLELAARGTILYFVILFLMRFMPRRTGGELATMDLIFLLLIAEAASNAFGEYRSVSEGLVLVLVLMGWNFAVNAASWRFRWIERLVSSPPIQVVRNGKMLKRNMRREFLTEEELMSALRQQGVASVEEVRVAYIEGEGAITVIKSH
ncbi:DUF421 domain-containing protein [Massilia sp. IC2-476]|uniref:DUF421 domain-containing protein n=1 Tax=Massilia sp. IC2-476 TaxID=2887199 RepID=UPI001D102EE9|nr:YetF domain-containing protein [Massilia sp. IC2-476]MCC2973887.1 DUF421 domain-containing protein [Massilia sp. IC2-476]